MWSHLSSWCWKIRNPPFPCTNNNVLLLYQVPSSSLQLMLFATLISMSFKFSASRINLCLCYFGRFAVPCHIGHYYQKAWLGFCIIWLFLLWNHAFFDISGRYTSTVYLFLLTDAFYCLKNINEVLDYYLPNTSFLSMF